MGVRQREAVDAHELPVPDLLRQRGLDRVAPHGGREIPAVVARNRSVDRSAVAPQRRAIVADAGAAGVLCFQSFFVPPLTSLRFLILWVPAPAARAIGADRLVDQVLLQR